MERAEPALARPGRHRSPQRIGLVGAEAGGHHGQLHHLLLKDRHAQGAAQGQREFVLDVAHRQPLALALAGLQVGVDHAALDRTRTDDRDFNH